MNKLAIDVFISSAMIELEYDREIIYSIIESMSFGSTMFEMFPAMAESPSETYLDKVRSCDVFILVLWKSFSAAVRLEYLEAIKCNKPVLIFLKTLKEGERRDRELVIFLEALRNGEYKASIYKEYRELKGLEREVKNALGNEVAKYYEFPKISQTKAELYELGSSVVNYSYNRIYLYESTPSLFLGSRDYLSPEANKLTYESRYLSALKAWVEANKTKEHTEFLYLFSIEKTLAELAPLKSETRYIDRVKESIKKYKQYEIDTGYRFRFLPLSLKISGPLIVGDTYYAMWFLGESIALSQKSEKISNEIVNQLNMKHDFRITGEDVLEKLDIRTS